ncbi:LacI family transcriptional regulator (plasmid) [Rhizobium sp. SSM4.3]|uniref:LacI family transcriptional regulator n=1 Tax=Peteryoungia algae TaxID=2919917 RepID=A0ABT0D594_9HYPH|nr:LacI family DNA-binding transcriptional regulator [Rhizobium sp. SSM4.3]MCJ8240570.1 LacI family transcriptional regulator [Rhizobium sp. SSM4.3]
MPVTLNDVAARAGVSPSAVSRTFTEGASVSQKTRHKVEKAARELGYTPSALASALSTGRTKLIGLVSNNFHNPIFLQVFDLFTRHLQERGLRPLLVNLSNEIDPAQSLRMLRQYSVDGVIVASSTLPPHFAEAFKNAGMPVVHSFGRWSSSPNVNVVGIDNVTGGRIAADTLIQRGYRRVAFLGGPEQATSTIDRRAGFHEAIRAHPAMRYTESFASAYSFEAGRAEMQRLMAAGDLAEAYFCGDDVLSIGAMSALKDGGLAIPDDVGIIGLNNMQIAGWENIALTTIHLPVKEIIQSSIELVVSLMEDSERHPEARIFPCRLVERKTLRPLP